MGKCPYCRKQHVNSIEEALCPMRPEQVALMVEQFGTLGKGKYSVTERVRYTDNGQEQTGVILWVVAHGNTGSKIEADEKLRYIVEREIPAPSIQEKLQLMKALQGRKSPISIQNAPAIFGNPFGFADGFDEVYENAIRDRIESEYRP